MKGFTIVEVLTATLVMAILSALLLLNWRAGGESLAVDRAAHQLAHDMRAALERALGGQTFSACADISGYGVHFDEATPSCYLLYAECNGNSTYEGQNCEGGGSGPDAAVEIVDLERGVAIQSVSPGPKADVLFTPPEPQVSLKPGNPSEVHIVLRSLKTPTKTKTIKINKRAVVDID